MLSLLLRLPRPYMRVFLSGMLCHVGACLPFQLILSLLTIPFYFAALFLLLWSIFSRPFLLKPNFMVCFLLLCWRLISFSAFTYGFLVVGNLNIRNLFSLKDVA